MAGNVVDANGSILEYAPGNETTDSSLAPVAPAMSAALSANGTPAPANSTLSSLANLFHLNIVSPTGINTGSQTGNILAYLQGAIAGQNKTAPAKAAASAFNASTIFSSPIFYIVVILIVGLVIWRIVKR